MSRYGSRRLRIGALLVVVCGLAAMSVVLGLKLQDSSASVRARTEGLAAATRLTPQLLGYDYRTPPQTDQVAGGTTGDFTKQYTTLVEQYLTPQASAQQFVTQVTVRDMSVVRAEPRHLVAMLFLSQVTTSTALPAPRLDASSVRVTLDEVDGRWLVAGLERV